MCGEASLVLDGAVVGVDGIVVESEFVEVGSPSWRAGWRMVGILNGSAAGERALFTVSQLEGR